MPMLSFISTDALEKGTELCAAVKEEVTHPDSAGGSQITDLEARVLELSRVVCAALDELEAIDQTCAQLRRRGFTNGSFIPNKPLTARIREYAGYLHLLKRKAPAHVADGTRASERYATNVRTR